MLYVAMLWGGGGVLHTVGIKCMYVQFKGVKGLVTVVLRNFFKMIALKLLFHPFSNKFYLSGTLSVYVEIQV